MRRLDLEQRFRGVHEGLVQIQDQQHPIIHAWSGGIEKESSGHKSEARLDFYTKSPRSIRAPRRSRGNFIENFIESCMENFYRGVNS